MNKTISVNIGGLVFNIEEQAYEKLKKYLASISSWFKGQEGEDEIIADIEQRVAELFTERLNGSRQVVTTEDVDFIIETMGQPEQYDQDHEEEKEQQESRSKSSKGNNNRRIYRDPEDSVVGGVASGISHYLGWDPVVLRVAFAVFTLLGLAAIPIYIILWIVIPEAKTTSEKLSMRGQKINVENISKAASKGAENFSDTLKNADVKSGADKLLSGLGSVFGFIGTIFRYIFGGAFLLAGTLLLVGCIVGLTGFSLGEGAFPISINFLKDFIFFSPNMFVLAVIAGIILTVVPIIGLIYTGIRLLLQFPSVKGVGITLISLFIFGAILASIATVNQVSEYSNHEQIEQIETLNIEGDLYIETGKDAYWHDQLDVSNLSDPEMMRFDGDDIVFCNPRLRFKPTSKSQFSLEVRREAQGMTTMAAFDMASEIEYGFELRGDTLILDPVFKAPKEQKFRDQEVSLTIYVPEGRSFVPQESSERLIRYRYNGIEDVYSYEIPGNTFVNDSLNLVCTSCE